MPDKIRHIRAIQGHTGTEEIITLEEAFHCVATDVSKCGDTSSKNRPPNKRWLLIVLSSR